MKSTSYTCFFCDKEFKNKNKPQNLQKPFCSSSCAAKHNNTLRKTEIHKTKRCLSCNTLIGPKNTYCSNQCQSDFANKAKVDRWLSNDFDWLGKVPQYIKQYLLQEQDNCCSICKGSTTWNNEPLVLIADHIDGNSSNNNRNNLRLVCPNCDSQLPTFKGRNRGNGRHERRMRYEMKLSY